MIFKRMILKGDKMVMLEVNNLFKNFDTNELLSGVSFQVKGEVVAIIGPSGSVKYSF